MVVKHSWFFRSVIAIGALVLVSACQGPGGGNESLYFPVVRVVDGDTFWVDDGSEKGRKIRLIGVDAPETRNTGRKTVGYFGQEAKKFLTALLRDQEVRLEYDVDPKDRYGRTLAYVYLRDGTFINAELVKRGYAMVMTVPPNVKFAEDFLYYQKEARENRRGLWNK